MKQKGGISTDWDQTACRLGLLFCLQLLSTVLVIMVDDVVGPSRA